LFVVELCTRFDKNLEYFTGIFSRFGHQPKHKQSFLFIEGKELAINKAQPWTFLYKQEALEFNSDE